MTKNIVFNHIKKNDKEFEIGRMNSSCLHYYPTLYILEDDTYHMYTLDAKGHNLKIQRSRTVLKQDNAGKY